MLHVNQLTKSFGSRVLIEDATFAIAPGEKVALVGRNGCGKTTLFRILCGEEPYDSGTLVFGPSCRLGYLGQEGQLQPDRTLWEEMQEVFADIDDLERQMRALEEQMGTCSEEETEALLSRYGRLQNRFEHSEPHLIEAKIATILTGMGFKASDYQRRCREFSGGWQMRGAMARLLLREPDLLLMDEPTNHLDVQTVEWLEEYLLKSSSTVFIVSHDRYFLDKLVKRTLELRQGKIDSYAGNYSFYLQEREVRRELQQAAYDNQQKRLAQEMKFVERFRYKATLATRVQSRVKMIEKRERIEAPDRDQRALKAAFSETVASGEEVLNIHRVCKAYGERQVLQDLSLKVERGERIALVGVNGVGKSTLLRLLANLEAPDKGSIKAGYKLAPVYYAQHQAEALDADKTVLEEAAEVAPYTDHTRIRTILGCLLFEGDDVNKKVGILSGGERSRVALSRCILTPSNLLLLDEPTNHLDITAREALLDALQNYEGTIIIVTHDRHFMNSIATAVVEIRDFQAFRYIGNYDEYHRKREAEKRQEAQALERAKQHEVTKTKTQVEKERKAVRQAHSGTHKIRWKLEVLEKRIYELEDAVLALGEQLGDPELYSDPDKAQAVQREYEAKKAEVEELTAIWDEMT